MSNVFTLQSDISVDIGKVTQNLKTVQGEFEKTEKVATKTEKTTSESFKKAGDTLKSWGSSISKAVGVGLTGAFTYATAGTKELREDMSKLSTTAKMTGFDWEEVNKQFKEFNAVSGESDSSIEAINNLMMSGIGQENLASVVNELSGAVVAFPDTMKIESLADSLQETIKTGAGTGQFIELLGRMGVDTEKFNKGLAEAKKEGTEVDYCLQALASTGLSQTADAWKENNKDLIENNKANMEFQQAMAKLGETVTPVLTQIVEGITRLVSWFNQLSPLGKGITLFVVGLISVLPTLISLTAGLVTIVGALSAVSLPITGTILLITALIAGVVAAIVLLWNKCEWFRNGIKAIWEAIKQDWNSFIDSIKAKWMAFKVFWSNVAGLIKADWNNLVDRLKAKWETIITPFKIVVNKIKEIWDSIKGHFKLPHFKLSGEFSLKKMTVPHVAIDWYSSGGIFTSPTVLGNIGVGDKNKGNGSNAEAVLPINLLKDYIREELSVLETPIELVCNGKVLAKAVARYGDIIDKYNKFRV